MPMREQDSRSAGAGGPRIRQIRDHPLAGERLADLASGQLETMAQIGNYDWNYPLQWKLA